MHLGVCVKLSAYFAVCVCVRACVRTLYHQHNPENIPNADCSEKAAQHSTLNSLPCFGEVEFIFVWKFPFTALSDSSDRYTAHCQEDSHIAVSYTAHCQEDSHIDLIGMFCSRRRRRVTARLGTLEDVEQQVIVPSFVSKQR